MSNKIVASNVLSGTATATNIYLDMAAELSVVDRKAHHQTSKSGKPLVYDLLVTINGLGEEEANNSNAYSCSLMTAPNNWQTRNAVRMAHFLREDLRKASGVSKGAIGKYARNMRFNLDSSMFAVAYDRSTAVTDEATTQRMYAVTQSNSSGVPSGYFAGGVWDYSQLTQLDDASTPTADPFHVNICGGHSATVPGPYTYVGALLAYNQRRQTVQSDATLTPGGSLANVDNDSPFFRIPETDVSEDEYVAITLDEQDNPPYMVEANSATDDAMLAQTAHFVMATNLSGLTQTVRVQAPLGLLQFSFAAAQAEDQRLWFSVECLGTYEM